MNISIIAAIGPNRELGVNNKMIWHIPADLKRFKAITSGSTIVMGRKTFESIGSKPLTDRRNIVLTRNTINPTEGVILASSVQEVMKLLDPVNESFIIGGASVYELFLPYTNKMYLTLIHGSFTADSYFPEYTKEEWEVVDETAMQHDLKSNIGYTFQTLVKIKPDIL